MTAAISRISATLNIPAYPEPAEIQAIVDDSRELKNAFNVNITSRIFFEKIGAFLKQNEIF